MAEFKNTKVPAKTIKQYYKRFAQGEQYISINPITGKIETEAKVYWWQQRGIYNKILPIIKSHGKDLSEEQLYGRTGLVALLEPYQRAYNRIMNLHNEHIEFSTYGFISVEDGSVDVEALEADGLCPGKVMVYRQGSAVPAIIKDELNVQQYLESAEYYYNQMLAAAEAFCGTVKKTGF